MLYLFFGLILVVVCFGFILADMDRKRRQLGFLLDRVEPLVDRTRRLHVRNLRGLNNSLFYAYNLMDNLEGEVAGTEQEKGLHPPDAESRFSLKPGRRYRDLEARITALEALAAEPASTLIDTTAFTAKPDSADPKRPPDDP